MIYPKDFQDAVDWLIKLPTSKQSIEGDYWAGLKKSDPNPTRHGITQKTYDRVHRGLDLPVIKVIDLSIDTAELIYYHEYWTMAHCYELTRPMNLIKFDTAVNCGVGRSDKILDLAKLNPDLYLSTRWQYYNDICVIHPDYKSNLTGWSNRLKKLRTLCKIG